MGAHTHEILVDNQITEINSTIRRLLIRVEEAQRLGDRLNAEFTINRIYAIYDLIDCGLAAAISPQRTDTFIRV